MRTIQDWEDDRAVREIEQDIATLAELPEGAGFELPPTTEGLTVADERVEIVALLGRYYAGLGVQLLWNRETGCTFITVTLGDENETFEVPRDKAADAFEHPFAYGATLKL